MKYNIKYEKACLKYLKKLDRNTQLRIIKSINQLPSGDVKKLQGKAEDYRLRVGKYRIVYMYENEQTIKIIKIDTRGDIYKD